MSKVKQKLLNLWFVIYDRQRLRRIRKEYPLTVMTSEETIDYIKKNNCSIARFGDGEFGLMLKTGAAGYQEISDGLSEALKGVFRNTSPRLLICMPYPMVSTKDFLKHGKQFWNGFVLQRQEEIVTELRQLMRCDYVFGDSFVSRPVSGYKSKTKSDKLFTALKQLWDNRDVLFVEGQGTRMGVGNDLFSNAKSIKRILAPAENAFNVYEKILDAITSVWKGELVIMALGPTATVLASDLAKKGIQALDMGHIDIQYEWYLAGESFKPVANKYVNEMAEENKFDACKDEQYLSQIVATVQST